MGLSRRQFTRRFKLAALQRLETGDSVVGVARAFEVNANLLHRWRREFRQGPSNAFLGLDQQALEIDFLKGCLRCIEEQRQLQVVSGRPLSTARSKAKKTEPKP